MTYLFRFLILPAIVLYTFVIALKIGLPFVPDLDASWNQVLGWAFETHQQFGKDVVFTFGPLGYFLWQPYFVSDSLFWISLKVQVLVYSILAAWMYVHLYANKSNLYRAIVAVILPFTFAGYFDIAFSLPWVLFFVSLLNTPKSEKRFELIHAEFAIIQLLFAFVSLGKFSFFAISGIAWLLSTIVISTKNSGFKGVSIDYKKLALSAIFPISIPVIWVAFGQSLFNFPQFVINSLEVSSGYSSAMVIIGEKSVTVLGTIAILLAALSIYTTLPKSKDPKTRIAAFLFISFWAFFAFKTAMIRQDHHSINVFVAALVLGLVAIGNHPKNKWLLIENGFTAIPTIIISCIGIFSVFKTPLKNALGEASFAEHWNQILHVPETLDSILRDAQAQVQPHPLADENGKIESVDIFHPSQGQLLQTGCNFSPRPIFQGYSAYTPKLARLNGDYMSGENAPEHMLVDMRAIDEKLPSIEDPLTLLYIIQNYEAVSMDSWGVHFQKIKTSKPWKAPEELDPKSANKIPMGEWFPLPDTTKDKQLLLATYHLKFSLLRKIQTIVFRDGVLVMDARFHNGIVMPYKLTPTLADVPFLLSPHIYNKYSLPGLFGDIKGKNIAEIRFRTKGFWKSPKSIQLRLQPTAFNNPATDNPAFTKHFDLLPINLSDSFVFGDREKVKFMFHAPSEAVFEPKVKGPHEIEIDVGFNDGAWDPNNENRTDGATFILQKRDGNSISEKDRIFLDPSNNRKHQTRHTLRCKTNLGPNDRIHVVIEEGGHAKCDWTSIYAVRIKFVHKQKP